MFPASFPDLFLSGLAALGGLALGAALLAAGCALGSALQSLCARPRAPARDAR